MKRVTCTLYSTWCIMICLVIPILSLLLFIQSLYSLSKLLHLLVYIKCLRPHYKSYKPEVWKTYLKHCGLWGYFARSVFSFSSQLTLTRGDNLLSECRIRDWSRWKRTYQPGISWAGVGNNFTYNHLYNAPHAGILGGGECSVWKITHLFDLLIKTQIMF